MDLLSELKNCKGGEQLELATSMVSKAVLRGFRFAEPVTLLRGTFDGLQMRDCAGFRFVATTLVARKEVDLHNPNRLTQCEDIEFTDVEIVGDMSLPIPELQGSGLFIDGCRRVTILRPDVHHVQHGIAHRGCDTLSITEGHFHHLRTDGIRGNGSSNLTMSDNYFHDFFPNGIGGTADHPDAIQLWADVALPSRNILIERNIIERGGGATIQGIFCRGDYPDARIPFENLRIIDNDLTGTLFNAIAVSNGTGEIRRNVIREQAGQRAWLRVENFTGQIEDNTAPHFLGDVPAHLNTLGHAPPRVDAPPPAPVPDPEPEEPAEPQAPEPEPVPELAPETLHGHLVKAEAESRAVMNTARRAHYAVQRAIEAAQL